MNNSGQIDSSELKSVTESLGLNLNESELKNLIHKIDTSGNDKLEFEGIMIDYLF